MCIMTSTSFIISDLCLIHIWAPETFQSLMCLNILQLILQLKLRPLQRPEFVPAALRYSHMWLWSTWRLWHSLLAAHMTSFFFFQEEPQTIIQIKSSQRGSYIQPVAGKRASSQGASIAKYAVAVWELHIIHSSVIYVSGSPLNLDSIVLNIYVSRTACS